MTRAPFNLEALLEKRWLLAALFALALVPRVVSIFLFSPLEPGSAIWEYGQQGLCAYETGGDLCLRDMNGNAYASALMPPLTSYLWAIIFSVFGNTSAALLFYVILNVTLGALCAVLVVQTARAAGLKNAPSFLAGLIFALYPTFIFVSATHHATNFTVALTLAFALFLIRAIKSMDLKTAALAGVFAGLAALTRNELLIAAAFGALLIVLLNRKSVKPALIAAACFSGAVGVVIAPWIIRNAVVFERFIPVGTQAGYNMWIGLGPYARASANSLDTDLDARAAAQAVRHSVPLGDEPGNRYEDRLQAAFLADAKPVMEEGGLGRMISLTAQKFLTLWTIDVTDRYARMPTYWGPLMLVNGAALLAIIGLAVRRIGPVDTTALIVFGMMLAVFALAYSLSGVFIRYRMHMEPFLHIFAALGIWSLIEALLPRRGGQAKP